MSEIDLFGASAPSAKFEDPGTTVSGVVLAHETKQMRQWYPERMGELLYWAEVGGKRRPTEGAKFASDGTENDPVNMLVIELDTGVIDPELPNDDGRRVIRLDNRHKREVVTTAFKGAGVRSMGAIDGTFLSMTFERHEQGKGSAPKKIYSATVALKAPASFESKIGQVQAGQDDFDI